MMENEKNKLFSELGLDPDPDGAVEKRIRVGWALVGIFFTLGIFGWVLKSAGLKILPQSASLEDYSRLIAFVISTLHIIHWMWFPLEDLNVLRRWVRTGGKILPCYTSGFLKIIFTMTLLVLLIISALFSAIYFNIFGFLLYIWNFYGFSYIRKEVKKAVDDAKRNCERQPSGKRELYFSALKTVENHWCVQPEQPPIWNWQQIRHLSLTGGFLLSTVVALLGYQFTSSFLFSLSYLLGTSTLIVSLIWVGFKRISRDRFLHAILEKLRQE